MTRLLIYAPSLAPIADGLRLRAPDLEIVSLDDAGVFSFQGSPIAVEDIRPDIVWFSGELYGAPAFRAFLGAVAAAPAVKWFQSAAAGFENPFFARIVASGAQLTTSHGQAVGMADYVMWGVLDAFQRGPERRAAQARGEWLDLEVREVLDSTWLVIGFGAIGQAVASRAKGFGAKVIGVRRSQDPHPLAERIAAIGDLPTFLPAADVVVMCAPLNAATRGLADAAFFAAMKPGSVIVNVGRGKSLDETALLQALETGAPGHAVLDVFDTEPLPAASPLWAHPRVTITAHCSGVTGGQTQRNAELFLDNVGRYLAGEPLLNLADPKDVLGA